jgi:pilus assembly protein CpaE
VLLRAIRASADEFVIPPLGTDLRRALGRIAAERRQQRAGTRPRGKVIGFFSAKGGCGSTTIACHVAAELRRKTGLGVLLADFDLDSGLVGFLMKTQSRYSVLDAIENIHRLDGNFWKALVGNGTPGIEVLMAPQASGWRPASLEDFRYLMPFLRSQYDWTVVDLGRNLSPVAKTVFEDLDSAVLVTTLDIPALHQAKQIVSHIGDLGDPERRLQIVLNRVPKRSEVTPKEIERMLRFPVVSALPNDEEALHEAYAGGTLVAPQTRLGRHYASLAVKACGLQETEEREQKRKAFAFL